MAVAGQRQRLQLDYAITGMCAGDALAFPLHWYYDFKRLSADIAEHYPTENTYYAVPKSLKHPSAWKYFSLEETKNETKNPIDIFNGQHEAWATEGTHYHAILPAGSNTSTTMLSRLLMRTIVEKKKYHQMTYLKKYVKYFTEPDQHLDTYIESVHRGFFRLWAAGTAINACGATGESCLSALTLALPLIAFELFQGVGLKDVLQHAIGHVSLATKAELINRRLKVLVWLVHRMLATPEKAMACLEDAFNHLVANDSHKLVNLVEEDDTTLFWGAGRGALGKSETGTTRGTEESVFSIS
eukprot:m.15376 g.15376  ORF g.15376 m.15376 type:complete len:299 (-) comp10733_c0_seq1:1307-2203(-)